MAPFSTKGRSLEAMTTKKMRYCPALFILGSFTLNCSAVWGAVQNFFLWVNHQKGRLPSRSTQYFTVYRLKSVK